jgi:hypothetical protein
MLFFTNSNAFAAQDTAIGVVIKERVGFIYLSFFQVGFQVFWL